MNCHELFFNRAATAPLPLFCAEHLATLTLTVLLVVALSLSAPLLRAADRQRRVRFAILAILFAEQIARLTFRVFTNPSFNPAVDLPLQLCHFAAFCCIIYLLTLSRKIFSIVAFWGVIGNLAILIPVFNHHFPHLEIWIFFLGHLGMLATVAYGFFIQQIRLNRSDLKIILTASALAPLLIIPANRLLHANYFYLAQPPPALAAVPDWLYWCGLVTLYFSLVAGIYFLFKKQN